LPKVAERIIVYGSPMGLEKTVSDGIISAIREVPGYGKLIQITAPISPGSSGSPVLNMQGEVIGIATFQFIEGQNLNFAIPSEKIANLKAIREKKTITTEELFWGLGWGENIESNNVPQKAYDKALYFIDKREYEKALPYLEIAIKTDISSLKAWAYFQSGFCYGKLESYAKTIEAYKQAINIDPDFAEACYNLGLTCIVLGYYTKAIEVFKQAIRIDPDFAEAYVGLGAAYLCIGDRNSALNEYKILEELDIDLANELFDLIY
jgi:tetratricopeptide (TPR) repeat protein